MSYRAALQRPSNGPRLAQGASDLNGDGDAADEVLHVYDAWTGRISNTGYQGSWAIPFADRGSERWMPFSVSELEQGASDLNGDGDVDDHVLHVYDTRTAEEINTRLQGQAVALSERWMLVEVHEFDLGRDRNGDGDSQDQVLHVVDLDSGEAINLGLDSRDPPQRSSRWFVFTVSEFGQGMTDLDGDGDAEDAVLHAFELASGRVINLRVRAEGDAFALHRSTVATVHGGTLHLIDLGPLEVPGARPSFRRGDCNDDRAVNISDATCILNWLFAGGEDPGCVAATNTNGEEASNIADATYLLSYLFSGGPAPVAPSSTAAPVRCRPTRSSAARVRRTASSAFVTAQRIHVPDSAKTQS